MKTLAKFFDGHTGSGAKNSNLFQVTKGLYILRLSTESGLRKRDKRRFSFPSTTAEPFVRPQKKLRETKSAFKYLEKYHENKYMVYNLCNIGLPAPMFEHIILDFSNPSLLAENTDLPPRSTKLCSTGALQPSNSWMPAKERIEDCMKAFSLLFQSMYKVPDNKLLQGSAFAIQPTHTRFLKDFNNMMVNSSHSTGESHRAYLKRIRIKAPPMGDTIRPMVMVNSEEATIFSSIVQGINDMDMANNVIEGCAERKNIKIPVEKYIERDIIVKLYHLPLDGNGQLLASFTFHPCFLFGDSGKYVIGKDEMNLPRSDLMIPRSFKVELKFTGLGDLTYDMSSLERSYEMDDIDNFRELGGNYIAQDGDGVPESVVLESLCLSTQIHNANETLDAESSNSERGTISDNNSIASSGEAPVIKDISKNCDEMNRTGDIGLQEALRISKREGKKPMTYVRKASTPELETNTGFSSRVNRMIDPSELQSKETSIQSGETSKMRITGVSSDQTTCNSDGDLHSFFEDDESYARALQEELHREEQEKRAREKTDARAGGSQKPNRDEKAAHQLQSQMYCEDMKRLSEKKCLRGCNSCSNGPMNEDSGDTNSDNSSESEGSDCLICRSEFDEGDPLKVLPCLHKYHSYCIDPWLYIKGKCPVCLFEVKTGSFSQPPSNNQPSRRRHGSRR
eukprot:Nk52_evm69s1810 gene=Nk52_evmTU69s1810